MNRAAAVATIILSILCADASWAGRRGEHREFHPQALAWVADEPADSPEVPTHLRIQGEVKAVRHERDGDTHVVLGWNGRIVVLECIPELPGPCERRPRVGQHIAAWGIHRFDAAPGHNEPRYGARGWHEIHPLLGWEPVN